jgi:hypothetical protein
LSPGSSFPIRYVSGGLLFLKPLGTFLTMRQGAFNRQFIFPSIPFFSTDSFAPVSNELQTARVNRL